MLSRIQTTQRNALRALAQWESRICAEDDAYNAAHNVIALMEYDRAMDSFNESRDGFEPNCYGMYANEGNE